MMVFDSDSCVLVIFCRRPRPGVGKQRIAATLGRERAFEISRLLLQAALEDARDWPGPVVVAPADACDRDWAEALLPGCTVIPQSGQSFGERIAFVDHTLREAGASRILFIGSDAPCLTTRHIATARSALEARDYVMAPATDGGVILLGAAQPWPDLTHLAWETPQLATDLEQACSAQGSVAHVEGGSDIDSEADLRAALPALRQDARPARRALVDWIERAVAHERELSVIVPVLNDTAALRALFERMQGWPERPDEIIVVDAGGNADCETLCRRFGALYVVSDAVRGLQSATGARASSGRNLWFLHADSEPPEQAVALIREHLGTHVGGYFRFRFAGNLPWYAHVLAWLINLRTRVGMPYGDQGLFVRRADYEAAGGIESTPLFEEVRLIRGLRARGRFGPVAATIGVSPRRWERDGWLRRSLHNRYLALSYMLGTPAERLAPRYRNEHR